MKVIRLILWLSLIGVAIMTTIVSCTMIDKNKDLSQSSDSITWDKAEFYPEYVIQLSESINSVGECCYWMIYDDIDAGFDNEVVSMDEITFRIIKGIIMLKGDNLKAALDKYEPMIYYNFGACVLLLSDKD